jgi:hypothetical protein
MARSPTLCWGGDHLLRRGGDRCRGESGGKRGGDPPEVFLLKATGGRLADWGTYPETPNPLPLGSKIQGTDLLFK